ncbi:MAG: hypothetical protein OXR84_10125 [Magnetovibrio sp.]|nr:hypothetical protein [Magnetovibrio sp.]
MTRRKLGTLLAITGILVAVLTVHTMDAVEIRALPAAPTAPAAPTTPATAATPSTVLSSVVLPPPPPLTPTVTPLAPQLASPAPRDITPLAAAAKPAQTAPAPVVKPLKPMKRKEAALRPIEPLTAKRSAVNPVPNRVERPPERTVPAPTPPLAENVQTSAADRTPEKAVRDAGRPLLKLLEHGNGPILEIAWPTDRRARSHLHRLFSQCYGMRVALLATDGRLYDADSPRGMPWAINTDRFSGFIRQSSGGAPLAERQTVMRIRSRHGLGRDAAAVRVFPRRADALLLGGLSHLVGPDYLKADRIRAAYRLADNRVRIDAIRVDGRPIDGAIDLTRAARRGCIL